MMSSIMIGCRFSPQSVPVLPKVDFCTTTTTIYLVDECLLSCRLQIGIRGAGQSNASKVKKQVTVRGFLRQAHSHNLKAPSGVPCQLLLEAVYMQCKKTKEGVH